MLLFALALATAHAAITSERTGAYVDTTFGLGMGSTPFASSGAFSASFGAWHGNYDQDLSFGRFWGAGLTIEQTFRPDAGLRTAYLAEVRRGSDLVVVGMHGFLSAGALVVEPGPSGSLGSVGLAARAGGAAEFRRSSSLGVALRLAVGVDLVDSQVSPAGSLTIGVQNQFARFRATK